MRYVICCYLSGENNSTSSKTKYIKLTESHVDNQQRVLSDHKFLPSSQLSQHIFSRRTALKPQKRSASHMKTLDTHLEVDHSFDFVRTLSAENIKLQEANVRLREAEGKRVHEHACLQKKVKRMERERHQLLNGLDETGFTEDQIEFIKRKGMTDQRDDSANIRNFSVIVWQNIVCIFAQFTF